MSHSSLAQFNKAPAVGYLGGMDFSRFADLFPAALGKSGIGAKYTFSDSHPQYTTQNAEELFMESVAAFAMEVPTNLTDAPPLARLVAVIPRTAETPPTWLVNINTRDASKELNVISNSIKSLFDQLDAKGVDSVNNLLKKIDVQNANEYHLLAILRSLFVGRHKLTNWHDVQQQARVEFSNRGLDTGRVMKGLDIDDV